ncbi:MAG: hypothetical protein CFE33_18620 [Pseudorhodobacter sp. PARRP1]|nr:MAG: hypothetical protein CFE33_18620 [Pseudorhodobacter sp. PARRP1]
MAQQATITPETQTSIDVAQGFYRDTLVYRNLNNFGRYVGDTYIQHAPAYGDGPGQLIGAVSAELTNDPSVKIRLHRTMAEGPYVAIHSVWSAGGEDYVYVDIWRVENGKLVEHWDHKQTALKEPANTNTMFNGPDANIYSKQDVEQNRSRALAVLASFDNPADLTAVNDFVAEDMIQHNPWVVDGRGGLAGYLTELATAGTKLQTTIAKTIAMGDMVLVHSRQIDLGKDGDFGTGYIDIFRFNDAGQIAEHWDISEAVPEISNNKNDIFGYPAK